MIYKHIPLYRFLSFCEESKLEKNILDCGAGGDLPALGLFAEYGYIITGIEFFETEIFKAKQFGEKLGKSLNIRQGDMKNLTFVDENFSFTYSYNSIFHMKKYDIKIAIEELIRVTKKGGLIFVNFLTTEDERFGEGRCVGNGEYEQYDDEYEVIHSYFTPTEAEQLLEGVKIIFKEERRVHRIYEGKWVRQGFVDYILQKN